MAEEEDNDSEEKYNRLEEQGKKETQNRRNNIIFRTVTHGFLNYLYHKVKSDI